MTTLTEYGRSDPMTPKGRSLKCHIHPGSSFRVLVLETEPSTVGSVISPWRGSWGRKLRP